MKRVSFSVAKYLKEAGYPQGETDLQYVTKDVDTFKCGDIIDSFYENWAANNVIDAPFVMAVWLWLWREKGIQITRGIDFCCIWIPDEKGNYISKATIKKDDPEEAIEKAIEYLVENNLIE